MTVPSSTTSQPDKNEEGCLDNFFNNFTYKLYEVFYNLGVYIDGNARKVIYITIITTVIAGMGFMNVESESRPEKVCLCACAWMVLLSYANYR